MAASLRSLVAAAGAVVVTSLVAGCAAAPLNKPIEGGAVNAGSGSLEAERRAFEGTWSLVSLETVDPRGARRKVTASGQLSYDAFGNMNIKGVIDDPALQSAVVLDFNGRIVIDPVKHEYRPAALETDRPVDPDSIAPVSPDKLRRYQLMGNSLVITYLNASAAPTAITTWRRESGPAPAPSTAR